MAYEQVSAQFSAAQGYAESAVSSAEGFIEALQNTVTGLQMPSIEIDLEWPEPPDASLAPTTSFALPSAVFPEDDSGVPPDAPDVSFTVDNAPTAPTLPVYTFSEGAAPSRPADPDISAAVTLPDSPGDWTPPEAPALINIAIGAFGGVNTHDDFAAALANMPDDLALVQPSSFVPPTEAQYDSAFLAAIKDEIRRRLAGGTGIAAEVEALIWARAQTREAALAESNVAEVMRNAEARGFALPTGAMAAQLREAQKTALSKAAELSRDIAIKQAELEQANVRAAIEQGTALEAQLIQYSNSVAQRAFDAARYLAENAVAIYNSLVAQYRANLEKYSTYASVYRSLIEGESAKVAVYRAEVDAERAKIDVNRSLIDQQRALIEARGSEVQLYQSEISAVQALLTLDNLKIQAFGERIRAYVADISAESVRAETYRTKVQGVQATADAYKSTIDAYATKLRATSDAAKAKAEVYDSSVRGFVARTQRYATAVEAASEQSRAEVAIAGLGLEQSRLAVAQTTSSNQAATELYRAQVALYEANKSIAVQQAQLTSSNYFALRGLVADASKVAAQVNAQLAASAYGTIQANASIQGQSSTNVGYSYSGKTASAVTPLTII